MPTVLTGSSLTWNTTFSLNTTPKKFIFLDNDPYTAAGIALTGVRGVFEITSPSGVVVYNNTTYGAGSDIVANVSLTNAITIQLPNLANQAPEQGVYTITYSVQINDGTNPVYIISLERTYDFTYDSPVVSITPQVDCIQPLFTATDGTDYIVNSITPTNTRTMTLDYPANSGGTPVTNTTSATITTSTFYNGLQAVTVSSVLSYTYGTGFYVVDTVTGTKSINVDCSYVCQIYCCLKTLRNNVENNRGVNDVQFARWESIFSQAMAQMELLFLAIDCGKQEDANSYITAIKLLANCTDECSCTDGTPTQVTGLGIQNVNVAVVSGGSPITVTSATAGGITTYTITFSSALVTQLSTMYNTVVAAGTGISVADSGVVSGVRTFTITNTNTAQNRMEFLCRLQYTSPTAVTITNSAYLYSGTNMNATATVANPLIATAGANNQFLVNGFQVSNNQNFKVTMELLVVTKAAAHGLNSLKTMDVEMVNKSSGSFYFRFVGVDGIPITNTTLSGTTNIVVNIKISE